MGDLYCDPNQLPGKAGCSVITDTHVLQEVIDLRLSYTADDPTLELRVRTRDDRVVLLQLAGVKQIRLERLTPRFWLDELQIEDVRPDQLEGIRFRVFARFDHSFTCLCSDLSITAAT